MVGMGEEEAWHPGGGELDGRLRASFAELCMRRDVRRAHCLSRLSFVGDLEQAGLGSQGEMGENSCGIPGSRLGAGWDLVG